METVPVSTYIELADDAIEYVTDTFEWVEADIEAVKENSAGTGN